MRKAIRELRGRHPFMRDCTMSTFTPRLGFPPIVQPSRERRVSDKDDLPYPHVSGAVAAGLGVGVFMLDCAIVCAVVSTLVYW
jgi:hypothetical protein